MPSAPTALSVQRSPQCKPLHPGAPSSQTQLASCGLSRAQRTAKMNMLEMCKPAKHASKRCHALVTNIVVCADWSSARPPHRAHTSSQSEHTICERRAHYLLDRLKCRSNGSLPSTRLSAAAPSPSMELSACARHPRRQIDRSVSTDVHVPKCRTHAYRPDSAPPATADAPAGPPQV